jgi:hypothetical protein
MVAYKSANSLAFDATHVLRSSRHGRLPLFPLEKAGRVPSPNPSRAPGFQIAESAA